MPFLFRSRRRHSTEAASWLIPIRQAVTFLQRGREDGDVSSPVRGRQSQRKNGKEESSTCDASVSLQTDRRRNNEFLSHRNETRLLWQMLRAWGDSAVFSHLFVCQSSLWSRQETSTSAHTKQTSLVHLYVYPESNFMEHTFNDCRIIKKTLGGQQGGRCHVSHEASVLCRCFTSKTLS